MTAPRRDPSMPDCPNGRASVGKPLPERPVARARRLRAPSRPAAPRETT